MRYKQLSVTDKNVFPALSSCTVQLVNSTSYPILVTKEKEVLLAGMCYLAGHT
jgi:hypothetical protein